jgi:hypothetical protein
LTPELGDAATASCPQWRNLGTSFDPMNPLPPITTVFMNGSLCFDLYFSNQPMALAERNKRQLKCLLHNLSGILLGQRHSVDMLKTMFADCARRILKATESPCFAAAANSGPFFAFAEKSRAPLSRLFPSGHGGS